MSNTKTTHVGDGATTSFPIIFPYLSATNVKVYVNNVLNTTPNMYTLPSPGTITFINAPPVDAVIKILRQTPIDTRLVDYTNGAVLTEAELDTDSLQAFYLAQENRENYSDLIDDSVTLLATNNGLVVSSPTEVVDQLVQYILQDPLAAEIQSRITDIDTNASNILSITSTVDGNTASIAQTATTVDGLEALYGVTLNVNGYITGFAQNNNGTTGTFQIMADNFYIVDPASGGQNPVIPFAVSGGIVSMQNVAISGDLISSGTIQAVTFQTAASGQRIVLNSSTNEVECYVDDGSGTVGKHATLGVTSAAGFDFALDITADKATVPVASLSGINIDLYGGYGIKVHTVLNRGLTIETDSDSCAMFTGGDAGEPTVEIRNSQDSTDLLKLRMSDTDFTVGLRIDPISGIANEANRIHIVLEPNPDTGGAPANSIGEDGGLLNASNGHLYFKRAGAWIRLS